MTATRVMLLLALTWLVIALVLALLMRRRGYDFYSWLVLGSVLGPLAVPIAFQRIRYHKRLRGASSQIASPMTGRFHVLFWYRGGAEDVQALRSALTLFGDRVTSLTLASVLDYDCETTWSGRASQSEAKVALEDIASGSGWDSADTVLLFGQGDRAIADYTRQVGIDMIVVGAGKSGAGRQWWTGRSRHLTRCQPVPVFIGPDDLHGMSP